MYNNFVIPLSRCLKISKQLFNDNLITRVEYNRFIEELEKDVVLHEFEKQSFEIEYDDLGNLLGTNYLLGNEDYRTTLGATEVTTYLYGNISNNNFNPTGKSKRLFKNGSLKIRTNYEYLESTFDEVSGTETKRNYTPLLSAFQFGKAIDDSSKVPYMFKNGFPLVYVANTDENFVSMYLLYYQEKNSELNPSKEINYTNVSISLDEIITKREEQNTYVGSELTDNTFSMQTNEFMKVALDSTKDISATNAQNILDKYKNGITTIEIKLILDKYYDENGNLVLDNEIGEFPDIGDTFKLLDDTNITYKITSSEFGYNGVPTVMIKAKEI